MIDDLDLKADANVLNQAWHKCSENIVDMAALCAKCQDKYKKTKRTKALMGHLHFSASTFSKLAHIGRDSRLHVREVRKALPSKYSLIYELSKLEGAHFEAAQAEGIIRPGLKRQDLARWRKAKGIKAQQRVKRATTKKATPPALPRGFHFAGILDGDFAEDELAELDRALDNLTHDYSVRIVRHDDATKKSAAIDQPIWAHTRGLIR